MKKRIRAVSGGTSASKSVSILLYLIAMAQNDKVPTLTSIVSESFPHLKKGAMRDFLNIMQEHGYFKDNLWNKTDYTYTFETGSKIEFFSVDVPSKVRGPRRDRLFINEANNVRYEAFDQLEIRTKEFIFLDWNPVNEFWFYTDIQHREDCEHLTLTYLDNDALDPRIVASIESRKGNTNWWRVYGLGLLGELEGKVFDNWRIIDEIPHEARLERYGLDFGYSQDPTACVAIYYINGGYILDEVMYKKEMSNREIGDTLINLPPALIVADCAEPKSIADLKEYGLNVIPCTKGKDSVINGIQHMQSQRISVTKRSLNLIKEYRSYMWKVDKNGRKLNVPEDDWNHCVAGDTIIHTTKGKKRIIDLVGEEGYLFSKNGKIAKFKDVRVTKENAEVLDVEFTDNTKITLTPDHLMLKPDGTWIESQLLSVGDLIQSVMYEDTRISRKGLQALSWREIFKSWKEKITQGSLGILQWGDTKGLSYRSHRREPGEQQDRESANIKHKGTRKKASDARDNKKESGKYGQNKTSNQEMAQIKRGEGVAQVTWERIVCEKKTIKERMYSLPFTIYNYTIRRIITFLFKQLQNESETKEVKRVSRRRCPLVFNMEVEGEECFLANGVVIHNCMDAIRYAMTSFKSQPLSDPYEELLIEVARDHALSSQEADYGL